MRPREKPTTPAELEVRIAELRAYWTRRHNAVGDNRQSRRAAAFVAAAGAAIVRQIEAGEAVDRRVKYVWENGELRPAM